MTDKNSGFSLVEVCTFWVLSFWQLQCREERICGRRTADSMTCHGCQHWLVPDLSPSPVHPGINYLHLFATWTVSQLSSVILKLSCLKQRMV